MKFSALTILFVASTMSTAIAHAQTLKPKILTEMTTREASRKLSDIGESAAAKDVSTQAKKDGDKENSGWALTWKKPKKVACWTPANHIIGYIATTTAVGTAPLDISYANNIQPDATLKDMAVKITLDRLRVACYPGGGAHNILFDFAATHQGASAVDKLDVHFTQKYRANEDDSVGTSGYPIFLGLKIGAEGLLMQADTVNVSNQSDVDMLGFMNDATFQNGLQLLNTTNPVMPVVTKFATGIFNMIGHRNDNIAVQHIALGLDFSSVPTHGKLREGAYVVVQADPETSNTWDWSLWKFYPASGQILKVSDKTAVPLNYMIFGISKMMVQPQ